MNLLGVLFVHLTVSNSNHSHDASVIQTYKWDIKIFISTKLIITQEISLNKYCSVAIRRIFSPQIWLRQKYNAPQVQLNRGSTHNLQIMNSAFHVPEMPST